MKKIISAFVTMLLVLVMAVSAMAQARHYVKFDRNLSEFYSFSDDEIKGLNDEAEKIYQQYKVGVYVYFANDGTETGFSGAEATADKFYANYCTRDAVVLAITDPKASNECAVRVYGTVADKLDEQKLSGEVMMYQGNRDFNFVKVYFDKIASMLRDSGYIAPSEGVGYEISPERKADRVIDNMSILAGDEKAKLIAELDKLSEKQGADIAICIVDKLPENYQAPWPYANDLYNYYGYGMGEDKSGCLLLLSIEDRMWAIATGGMADAAFPTKSLQYIGEKMKAAGLPDGKYYNALSKYAKVCNELLNKAKAGKPYGTPMTKKEEAIIAGSVALVAFLVLCAMWIIKKKNKKQ